MCSLSPEFMSDCISGEKQNKKPLWLLYLFFVISISLLYVKYALTWSSPEGEGPDGGSSVLPASTLRGKGPG